MASYNNFYEGADYGLDPKYGNFLGMSYRTPPSMISQAVDPRTANQLQATSEKLNTGGKAVEVQMLMPDVMESVPNQNLEEINRLRKLVGAELTVHGPLIEPTGIGRERWEESQREQAERQIWSAVERSHKMNPDGNIIVTMHSSNGLPEPKTRVLDKDGNEITRALAVIDERAGNFGAIPISKENYFLEEETKKIPDAERVRKELQRFNEENWSKALSNITIEASRGKDAIRAGLRSEKGEDKNISELFNLSIKDPQQYKGAIQSLGEQGKIAENKIEALNVGQVYLKDAYSQLQEMFNEAYIAAQKGNREKDLQKLKDFRGEVSQKMEGYKENPLKISEFADEITRGVELLNTIKTPERLRPIQEFAIDKASETFSNVAFQSFDKFGKTSPILSIENPPVGSGLNRAEDLRELVKETRKKFAEKAIKEKGLSKSEAENQAKKLIGATWDVGHINMMRKYGYGKEHLLKETSTIAPFVKHVHLSDNFGMEHTELPMGMGNVPTKEHMEIIDKYNKQVKKVIEAGNWFQHFKVAPFAETLEAYGSPVYPMQMAPYWNQIAGASGNYFSGKGLNPDIHHSMYGSGFANLPTELGGQMSGRSRVSGAPME